MATHLLRRDRTLVRLPQFVNDSRVPPQILLAANEDDGETGAEVHDLRDPLLKAFSALLRRKNIRNTCLLLHVIEGVWRVDGKADQDDMGVGVRQRPQAIVVFLSRGIP